MSNRIDPKDPPEKLAEIEHKQFYNLVDADLRRKIDPVVSEKLRHPAVAMRWHIVLLQMRRSSEGAIASRKSEFQAARSSLLDEIEKMEALILDAGEASEYINWVPPPSVDGPRGSQNLAIVDADHMIEKWRSELRELGVEFEEWRVKTLRFKAGVDEKIAEAEWARHRAERSILESSAIQERTLLQLALGVARTELESLVDAIARHRASVNRPTEHDTELWEALAATLRRNGEMSDEVDGALNSPGAEVRRLLGG